MHNASLILVVNAHQPFIGRSEYMSEYAENYYFISMSNVYLPMLRMLFAFERESVPCRLALCFSPQLCSMASDPALAEKYIAFLDAQSRLLQKEKKRARGDKSICAAIDFYIEKNCQNKHDFFDNYECDVLAAFKHFRDEGAVEFLGTAAGSAFLPLYMDIPESINAQIEMGLMSYRDFFGDSPLGFWAPNLGYYPGIEIHLKNYGYSYTFLESHGFLFSNPAPEQGVFAPTRLLNKMIVFGKDYRAFLDIFRGKTGYADHSSYCDEKKDVGFELKTAYLADSFPVGSRTHTGIRYRNKAGGVYSPDEARRTAIEDARDFVRKRRETLKLAAEYMNDSAVSVCPVSAHAMTHGWSEGVYWLENVFREIALADSREFNFSCAVPREAADGSQSLQSSAEKIQPVFSSARTHGYAEDWLDNANEWMYRYCRNITRQMISLATKFSDCSGLKERLLNLAARQVLLVQDSALPLMVYDRFYPDYAVSRIEEIASSFSVICDFLGSNTVSTEWLTAMEKKYDVFAGVNFRIFREKE